MPLHVFVANIAYTVLQFLTPAPASLATSAARIRYTVRQISAVACLLMSGSVIQCASLHLCHSYFTGFSRLFPIFYSYGRNIWWLHQRWRAMFVLIFAAALLLLLPVLMFSARICTPKCRDNVRRESHKCCTQQQQQQQGAHQPASLSDCLLCWYDAARQSIRWASVVVQYCSSVAKRSSSVPNRSGRTAANALLQQQNLKKKCKI